MLERLVSFTDIAMKDITIHILVRLVNIFLVMNLLKRIHFKDALICEQKNLHSDLNKAISLNQKVVD